MTTTDQDLRALTYLARRLRDDTHGCRPWDDAGTFAVLKSELANTNLLIACQRVIGHATDPDAKTPGAIKRPYIPAAEKPTVPHVPYDPRAICHICSQSEHPPSDHRFVSIEAKRAAKPAPIPPAIRNAVRKEKP